MCRRRRRRPTRARRSRSSATACSSGSRRPTSPLRWCRRRCRLRRRGRRCRRSSAPLRDDRASYLLVRQRRSPRGSLRGTSRRSACRGCGSSRRARSSRALELRGSSRESSESSEHRGLSSPRRRSRVCEDSRRSPVQRRFAEAKRTNDIGAEALSAPPQDRGAVRAAYPWVRDSLYASSPVSGSMKRTFTALDIGSKVIRHPRALWRP